MTPFDNCVSAGMCWRTEVRYMIVFCRYFSRMLCAARRYATLKQEKPGGWGYVNNGKPVSYDYIHVLCFFFRKSLGRLTSPRSHGLAP